MGANILFLREKRTKCTVFGVKSITLYSKKARMGTEIYKNTMNAEKLFQL